MKLREYLRKHNLTIAEAARQLEIHHNHLSLILNGKRNASVPLAREIEQFTNGEVKIEDVITEKKERARCPTCGRKLPH